MTKNKDSRIEINAAVIARQKELEGMLADKHDAQRVSAASDLAEYRAANAEKYDKIDKDIAAEISAIETELAAIKNARATVFSDLHDKVTGDFDAASVLAKAFEYSAAMPEVAGLIASLGQVQAAIAQLVEGCAPQYLMVEPQMIIP